MAAEKELVASEAIAGLPSFLRNAPKESVLVPQEAWKKAVDTLARFSELPGRSTEEYKYTDTDKFFPSDIKQVDVIASSNGVSHNASVDEKSHQIVFRNGVFVETETRLPNHIRVTWGSKNRSEVPQYAEAYFASTSDPGVDFFAALNTIRFHGALFIEVLPSEGLESSVRVIHHYDSDSSVSELYFPRMFIHAHPGANACFLQWANNKPNGPERRVVGVTEIRACKNSKICFYRLQHEGNNFAQIQDLSVLIEEGGEVDTNTLTIDCVWVRNNLSIRLAGRDATAHLNGLFITAGRQHSDMRTLVEHQAEFCKSNQVYKGVLAGKSTGVFNGRIFVFKDAQKTDAYQSSKNILLTDDASVYSKPQLEIFADDVKCSHGSTTGQLSEDAQFYLQSRGLSKESARSLLVSAFASEVLETLKNDELRKIATELVFEKMNKGLLVS
ncbi:MAG: hypothetical protein RLZZ46_463 [Bacteroidota bacterium]